MPQTNPALAGIAFVTGAYFLFALQDAVTKLLVTDGLPVAGILFVRSAVILLLCALVDRRIVARSVSSPVRGALLLRGLLLLAAWLFYYSSARSLQLAEMMTLYFASPLIVAVLAIPMLGEKVPLSRFIATGLGFCGVLLAVRPTELDQPLPVLLALSAAVFWACGFLMMRAVARAECSSVQIFVTNLLFLALCAAALPWLWVPVTFRQAGILLVLGLVSAAAQYMLYEGIKDAPASVAAPLEFTALIWAFGLGYLIWGEVPAPAVFAGAALITVSGVVLALGMLRQGRQGRGVAKPARPAGP